MPDNQDYDRQTVEVMRRILRRDSNAIDVGAHEGSILSHIVSLAPSGRHFAFEPLPGMAASLRRGFPNVAVFELALSDARGEASFQHVVTNPGYSGLKRRRYDRPHEELVEIRVQTERMDAVVPLDLPIHLIKIDVEGAELGVLRGGLEILRRHRPVVVFEHGLGAADYYGTRPEDIHDLLAEAGMRASTMERWLANHAELSRAEFSDRFHKGLDYYFLGYPEA